MDYYVEVLSHLKNIRCKKGPPLRRRSKRGLNYMKKTKNEPVIIISNSSQNVNKCNHVIFGSYPNKVLGY